MIICIDSDRESCFKIEFFKFFRAQEIWLTFCLCKLLWIPCWRFPLWASSGKFFWKQLLVGMGSLFWNRNFKYTKVQRNRQQFAKKMLFLITFWLIFKYFTSFTVKKALNKVVTHYFHYDSVKLTYNFYPDVFQSYIRVIWHQIISDGSWILS